MTTPTPPTNKTIPAHVQATIDARSLALANLQQMEMSPTPFKSWSHVLTGTLQAISTTILTTRYNLTPRQHSATLSWLRDTLICEINSLDKFAQDNHFELHTKCPDTDQSLATAAASSAPNTTRVSHSALTSIPPSQTHADTLVGTSSPPLPTSAANPPPRPPPQAKPHNGPKAKPPPPRRSPCGAKKPARLIVHCKGRDLPFVTCTDPTADNITSRYGLLAGTLRRQAPNVSILGMHRNRTGNLILSFPEGTPRATLMDLTPTFRSCLSLPSDIRISFDTPWSTLHLANVIARGTPDGPVHSEENLAETLLLNPALKSLMLTQQPRWIRKPDTITGSRTSAVICFEDADGSIARNLIKTQIFAFGAPVTVKSWLAKPVSSPRVAAPPPRPTSDMELS